MANSTITGLSAASSLAGTEVLPIDQSGTTVKATVASVAAYGNREKLTANRSYYVATTGNDSNTGLTVGSPFLTLQKAVDTVSSLDVSIYNVTINVADGTYNENVELKPFVGAGRCSIVGNSGTPANVIVNGTSVCFLLPSTCTGWWAIESLKITSSSIGLQASVAGAKIAFSNLNFGACTSQHMNANTGGYILCEGNYTISGAAAYHWRAASGGEVRCQSKTVTITGTPAFGTAFAQGVTAGIINGNGNTFSGSATGKRYDASVLGLVYTNGGGATYLPGDSAGTTATNGIYA